MFATISIPIFDERHFLPARTSLTRRPSWPAPGLSRAPFQRNLGAIVPRPLGGVLGWAGETQICEVRRSLVVEAGDWMPERVPLRAKYKRLYADGEGGAYFSIGVVIPQFREEGIAPLGRDLEQILAARLRSPGRGTTAALRDAGPMIADLFGTGATKGNPAGTCGLFTAKPLITLQGSPLPFDPKGRGHRHGGEIDGVRYAISEVSRQFAPPLGLPVFVLEAEDGRPRDRLRTARIIVNRLYLELFCFERCLALLLSPRLDTLDDDGLGLLKARIALSAERLTGHRAPLLADRLDLYAQLGAIFERIHQPGQIDELHNALRKAGASPNLARAVMTAAEKTRAFETQLVQHVGPGATITMSTYNNYGQAGAMGNNAQASDFTQQWANLAKDIDLPALADQLAALRADLAPQASSAAQMGELTAIVEAQEAATAKDGPGVLKSLAKVGKWSLGAAEKIGVALAAAIIKDAAGL
ncbi:hypothetical protein FHS96_005551 [Sphingomonas zeicaulis]|uniref:hypothetical protein n=1 Tax=Sphingomonas zeicaulis TaxID=1632740 RepID=UPI003D1CC9AE